MSNKIDLSLLKKLVSELENNLTQTPPTKDIQEYVIHLAKCSGLSAMISQEAIMIVGDINHLATHSTSEPNIDKTLSTFEKLFGVKGNGNN